jgi:hypothetical protein
MSKAFDDTKVVTNIQGMIQREMQRAFQASVCQSILLVVGEKGFHPGKEVTNQGTFNHGERSHIAKAFTDYLDPIARGIRQDLADVLASPHMVIKFRNVASCVFNFGRKGVKLNEHKPFHTYVLSDKSSDAGQWRAALRKQMPGWNQGLTMEQRGALIAQEAQRLGIPFGSYAVSEFDSVRKALAHLLGYGGMEAMTRDEFKAKESATMNAKKLSYLPEEYWDSEYAEYMQGQGQVKDVDLFVMKMGKASAYFWSPGEAYVFPEGEHAGLYYLPNANGELLDAHYCADMLKRRKRLGVDRGLDEKLRACELDKARIRRVLEDHDSDRVEAKAYEFAMGAISMKRKIAFLVHDREKSGDVFKELVFHPRLPVRVPESVKDMMDAMGVNIEIPADKRYHSFVEEGEAPPLDVVMAIDGRLYVLSNQSADVAMNDEIRFGKYDIFEDGDEAQHILSDENFDVDFFESLMENL